jgi:cytochrome c-type biogenesis protein CcmH
LLAFLLLTPTAHAETPQEARAQHLFTEVRCVVCQGESIADSDAAIAADMRSEIRADIARGMSDKEIRGSLYKRYGDYVLFRPRLSKLNLILWLIPPLVAIGGIIWLVIRARKPVKTETYQLTSEEREKLADVLEE